MSAGERRRRGAPVRAGAVLLEAQRVGQEPRDVARVVDGAVLRPLEREADAAQGP
ncbi:hypothetical protein [Sorangium sp. So ce388]|uniref:hypothetical protein n=1 Tax=Sorangium sp. So ce388 TaxID=3133309 RepID=UPI003F5B01C6